MTVRASSPRALARLRPPPSVLSGLAALAVALIGVGAYLANDGWRVSVLVHMSGTEPMAEVARTDPDFAFVDPAAHYDGVYFYAIALDPLAIGREHTLIDAPANRYGHPAYGWLAGLLSLGQARLLPLMLLLVSLASIYVAGVAAGDLAATLGASPWLGLAVALNPGLVLAVTQDTAEAFGAALLLLSLWLWLEGRRGLAGALIVPLCFTKEPLLALPAGLVAWEVVGLVRARAGPGSVARRLLPLFVGPVLYAIWLAWVHRQFGVFPLEQGLDRLSFPFTGWADTLGMAFSLAVGGYYEMQSGQAAIALLAVAFGAVVIGAVASLRLRSPIHPVFLLSALLMVSLGWLPLLFPKDLVRIMAFVVLLLPLALTSPRSVRAAGGTGSTR